MSSSESSSLDKHGAVRSSSVESSSRGAELQQVKEELAKAKKDLTLTENAKVQAQMELASLKLLVDELTFRLKEAVDISMKDRLWASKLEHASIMAAEDWQADLDSMQKQHDAEICRMREANERLKEEIKAACDAKEAAKIAVETSLHLKVDQLKQSLSESMQEDMELIEANSLMESLQCKLADAKEAEHVHMQAAMNVSLQLNNALMEIDSARLVESESVTLITSVHEELERTQQRLHRASVEVATLAATLRTIGTKFDSILGQLMELRLEKSGLHVEAGTSVDQVVEAADGLEMKLLKEHHDDNITIASNFTEAKTEAHVLREHITEAHMEAKKRSIKFEAVRQGVLSLRKAFDFAQCDAQKAQKDLQIVIDGLQLAREMANLKGAHFRTSLSSRQEELQGGVMGNEAKKESRDEAKKTSREEKSLVSTENLVLFHEAGMQRTQLDVEVMKDEHLPYRTGTKAASTGVPKEEEKPMEVQVEDAGFGRMQGSQDGGNTQPAMLETDKHRREVVRAERVLEGGAKSREHCSESWEMVERGSAAGIPITEEEYDAWKHKMKEAEELRASIVAELESLRCTNERLSLSLHSANLEVEAVKASEQDVQQLYKNAEHEKLILEAEVQRLANRGEQLLKAWDIGSNAFSLSTAANYSPLILGDGGKVYENGSSKPPSCCRSLSLSAPFQVEEEEEESAEASPIFLKKKKKKALLLRIGTYLAKRSTH